MLKQIYLDLFLTPWNFLNIPEAFMKGVSQDYCWKIHILELWSHKNFNTTGVSCESNLVWWWVS